VTTSVNRASDICLTNVFVACAAAVIMIIIIVIVIVAQFSFVVLEVIEQLSKALFKRDIFLC
jgi:hypothetical protein